MPSNHLILCCPFLLPPSIFPSIRVFSVSWLFRSGNPMDCGRPNSSVHGDSPGMNTGVGSHFLLQGIFLTQGSNLCLLTSPALAGRFFTTTATWETLNFHPHLQRVTTVSFFFFLIFWPHPSVYRILVPQPGMEPESPAVEAQSLNHWTAREVPAITLSGFLCILAEIFKNMYSSKYDNTYLPFSFPFLLGCPS